MMQPNIVFLYVQRRLYPDLTMENLSEMIRTQMKNICFDIIDLFPKPYFNLI